MAEQETRQASKSSTVATERPTGVEDPDADKLATLQPLLERAMRETLREMARAAGDPKAGAAQTLESIVRSVSTRIVQGHGGVEARKEDVPTSDADSTPSPAPIQPMLSDLLATPWELWREAASPVRGFTCQYRTPESRTPESRTSPNKSWKWTPESRTPVSKSIAEIDGQVSDVRSPSPTSPMEPMARASSKMLHAGLTMGFHSAQHTVMQWRGAPGQHGPRSVLLVAKPSDHLVFEHLQDMAKWLSSQGVVTVLEPEILADQPKLWTALPNVRTFSSADELELRIDLVITIGGDGTLTWATSRFPGAMPPVLSFAAGSLGFLTPFPLDGWVRTLTRLFLPNPMQLRNTLVCRLRLHVSIHRRGCNGRSKQDGIHLQCLNEVLLHRGSSGHLCKFDLNVDGEKVTVVQGDGIIVATPTGSTAYSLSAGGSMVHPGVPGMLLTPVSPHSLSFRPAVLPDSAEVCLTVPLTARHGASVTVDGKDVCMVETGDSVHVTMSPHPVPTVCHTTETADWFASVHSGLQWNGRVEQK